MVPCRPPRQEVLFGASAPTYVASTANAREANVPFRSMVPNGWSLAPPEPQSYGGRFVSPSGDTWLWFLAVSANREATVNANTDRLAPGPPERVIYEARGGDWLVTSAIFYRRAMLACSGTKLPTLSSNILHGKALVIPFLPRSALRSRALSEQRRTQWGL
jgi:hypothetical protein